jgi:hypothetical protein
VTPPPIETRYVVAKYHLDSELDKVVVEDGFGSWEDAQDAAVRWHGNTGAEFYAARLVPIRLDLKPSLVIVREQTAAIASTTTSTATRTEQIYQELQVLRTVVEGMAS